MEHYQQEEFLVWKLRSSTWKTWKLANGITKKQFKLYRQRRTPPMSPSRRRSARHFRSCEHRNSFTNHLRDYDNRADLMFIILSSSNFLHSGPFFHHIDNSLTIDSNIFAVSVRHVPFCV
ncbi:hypothetical protein RhiirA4_472439 [Rhizophagus irregularis]|uniref:Uncharacterized protein n=1 Tax=Rhizophagus irregularis TaxID=588596 RepID=A0A2I1H4X6_9GLOM|nr:hypothetical protein RhiirA4_472439 [Rhizophagus irregularis]